MAGRRPSHSAAAVRPSRRRHRRDPCGSEFALSLAVVRQADRRPFCPASARNADRDRARRRCWRPGRGRPRGDPAPHRRVVLFRRLRSDVEAAHHARSRLDWRGRRQPEPGQLEARGRGRPGVLHRDGPHQRKLFRALLSEARRRWSRLGAEAANEQADPVAPGARACRSGARRADPAQARPGVRWRKPRPARRLDRAGRRRPHRRRRPERRRTGRIEGRSTFPARPSCPA